ncbi:MFS general substrate transporter [Byssothecium circinans]|uniref:MFS general substrate transporter n=1 Tax=Byssothecium circinans TaxID=147558 RepID=A0A6A5TUE7_9PLEO|nr:MFS general substrate transporter [Byssothecium circinans]
MSRMNEGRGLGSILTRNDKIRWHNPSLFWILTPFTLLSFTASALAVPKFNLVLDIICRQQVSLQHGFSAEGGNCEYKQGAVQSQVSRLLTLDFVISGLLGIIIAPRLGALSDQYGRVYFLMLAAIGQTFDQCWAIFVATHSGIHYSYLLLGTVVDGLCGGFAILHSTTHAYVSDCRPPNKIRESFSYLSAFSFLGSSFGIGASAVMPLFGGDVPSMLSKALLPQAIAILIITLFLPESRSQNQQLNARRRGYEKARSTSTKCWQIWKVFGILFPMGERQASVNLLILCMISMAFSSIGRVAPQLLLLYARTYFGWGLADQAIFNSIGSSCRFIVLIAVLPLAMRYRARTTPGDGLLQSGSFGFTLIQGALMFEMAAFLLYGFGSVSPLFFVAAVLSAFSVVGGPAIEAALVNLVSSSRTGEVLSVSASLNSAAKLIVPSLLQELYSATADLFPRSVFFCISALLGCALGLSFQINTKVVPSRAARFG